jgi:glyoxylase-like metal-dependent hydrolase (beta-lactamase superfamily II)
MIAADDVVPVAPGLALWHLFDPAVKADLFATAVMGRTGTFLIDPIPATPLAREELLGRGPVRGIIVTNANHWRASVAWAEQTQAPVYAHSSSLAEAATGYEFVQAGAQIQDTLTVIAIEGGPPGEIALHLPDDRGTLIVGDALIHFQPYGFTLLPAKYCTNQKQMRRSLRQLLDYDFERILFAHGTPILADAKKRLEEVLNGD